MPPTINVNLKACSSSGPAHMHLVPCGGAPILIPCPIQRSITFEVALGECACGAVEASIRSSREASLFGMACLPGCPARPIKVVCSITGETWEESEVDDVEVRSVSLSREDGVRMVAICRERWALVKAMVLGEAYGNMPAMARVTLDIFVQRDTVFAALADMARAETALHDRWQSLPAAIKKASSLEPYCWDYESTPTTEALAAYVEQVIEQAGVMQ